MREPNHVTARRLVNALRSAQEVEAHIKQVARQSRRTFWRDVQRFNLWKVFEQR